MFHVRVESLIQNKNRNVITVHIPTLVMYVVVAFTCILPCSIPMYTRRLQYLLIHFQKIRSCLSVRRSDVYTYFIPNLSFLFYHTLNIPTQFTFIYSSRLYLHTYIHAHTIQVFTAIRTHGSVRLSSKQIRLKQCLSDLNQCLSDLKDGRPDPKHNIHIMNMLNIYFTFLLIHLSNLNSYREIEVRLILQWYS